MDFVHKIGRFCAVRFRLVVLNGRCINKYKISGNPVNIGIVRTTNIKAKFASDRAVSIA